MRNLLHVSASAVVLLMACGGEPAPAANGDLYGSDPNKTVVIGAGAGAGTVSTTPSGNDCINLPSGACVQPQKECKSGERADVIVDSTGKVVEIVCYPADANPTAVEEQGNAELGKGNKAIVAIDGVADGTDVGSITSAGNNVTVFGEGPAVSVIGGAVDASGNNFAMRGVTVKGNVEIAGNNAVLVLSVIEGDVHITGNNNVIADCSVLGKITIEGNNNVLVANEVVGAISVSDTKNLVCDSNVVWADANGNRTLDPGEQGAPLTCGSK